MIKYVERIKEYIILATIFVFPLAVSSAFSDQVLLPKLIVLGFGIALTFLAIALEIFVTGKFKILKSKFDLPILLLALTYLVSSIIVTPNKLEAFFAPGNASLVIGLTILYFLTNLVEDKKKIKLIILSSAVVISLLTFATFAGVFDKIPQFPTFVKSPLFNTTGDFLTSSVFLIAALVIGIEFLIKEKLLANKIIAAFSVVFIFVGIGISVFTLSAAGKNAFPVLPGFSTSWDVAIESVKENPLLGVGPGNYLTAFNRFRAISYNSTNLWQVRFASAQDLYLTILTETGILGGAVIVFFAFLIIKIIQKAKAIYKESHSMTVDLVLLSLLLALLIFLALFPSSPVTLELLFVLFALNAKATAQNISFGASNSNYKIIPSLAIVVIVGFFALQVRPIIAAEHTFKEASDALNANDGKKTYQLLNDAITLSPYVDRYHAAYAQVNLAIARSIIASVKDPKNLSDTDKSTITSLIQQAIREAQNTVSLNPTRSANWEVMANIYQSIIPFAAQANTYAIQSYNQAISLDPLNPNLRIEFGQLLYSLQTYPDAINAFQLAVLAKPDLPNSHYNLAIAYRDNKQIDQAIAEMQNVLSLVKKGTSDYTLAQTELTNLQDQQKKLNTATPPATNSANLTTPQKAAANTNPAVTLPSIATPPPAPVLPTPTASPVATSTP